jgi:hypothetical protein
MNMDRHDKLPIYKTCFFVRLFIEESEFYIRRVLIVWLPECAVHFKNFNPLKPKLV